MHAAILYQLTGEPDQDTIESRLDQGFPAIDVDATRYLDGKTLHHGTAAARIEEEIRVPIAGERAIISDTEQVTRRVQTDFYVDLEEGWVAIDSGDGEFLFDLLLSTHGVVGESIDIALDAWAERFRDQEDASVWGLSYADKDDNGETIRAGAGFHRDASVEGIPPEGVSALGFAYRWGGEPVRGMIAKSGYVAVYRDWIPETFAKWLDAEVLPYTVYDVDSVDQSTFDETREEVEA